jgi:DNA polymerase-3 subunit gamma/tau
MRLFEKYRPQKLNEIVGQKKAVETVKSLMKSGLGGRAYWISGVSGSGKTSLARIIASSIADPFFIEEFDAGWGFSNDDLKAMSQTMQMYGGGSKKGRVYIINEAHGLRKWIIQQLLGVLERLPNHIAVIFTTTRDGQDGLFEEQIDAGPLLSRCIEIHLTTQGIEESFAKRCKEIAMSEGLDGYPIGAYLDLAKKCKNNFRAMLQKIEAGEMKK